MQIINPLVHKYKR